jgi:CPA1 family monovalent cation:H+ antiporter
MESLLQRQVAVLAMLLVASGVTIFVRRFRIPYTVALVLAGLILSFTPRAEGEVDPDLIMSLLVPPLVFEAALHLSLTELRRNISTLILMAVPGVILTMLLVGVAVSVGAGVSWPMALLFGALIAATDPVAVIGIFRKLGAPKRLTILLEGESLLNDGTAIVLFQVALAAAVTGQFNAVAGLIDFLRVGFGGIVVGLILGWLISRLIDRIDDHLVETTLTTVMAFGSYLVAEDLFHVSGLLAVVAAGLVAGSIGPRGMSPTTRIVLNNFWEYVAFLANSAVFLLIGIQVDFFELLSFWPTILVAIAAVLASRAVVVYLLSRFGRQVPNRWRHVLFWGGLRGAIALALALSIPAEAGPERQTITAMAFGVVLFTLLAQGITMDRLIKRLRIILRSQDQIEYEVRHARAIAERAGFDQLTTLHDAGLISSHTWRNLQERLGERLTVLADAVNEKLQDEPALEIEELITARRESLRAQRSALVDLRRDGVISNDAYEELGVEIDAALEIGLRGWAESMLQGAKPDIRQLIMAVVQGRDLESAIQAVSNAGLSVTQIQATGRAMQRQSHLLLIGLPEGKLEVAVTTLQAATRNRVEYVSTPVAGMEAAAAKAVPVNVRGATVFVLDIERVEVF